MRLLENCFLNEKSLLGLKYTELRGLHVIAKKSLDINDMKYLVKKHVTQLKEKVDDHIYALDFWEYKEPPKKSAKLSNKSAKCQPVWDGLLHLLRFGCDKHCNFNIELQPNIEDSNRYDYYLQIQKDTCAPGDELTIFHDLVESENHSQYNCPLCECKDKSVSSSNLMSKNNVIVIQNGFYKLGSKIIKCRYVHEDGNATFFMSGGKKAGAKVQKFVVKDLELTKHFYHVDKQLYVDDQFSSISLDDHVVRVGDSVYNIVCKDILDNEVKYNGGTIMSIIPRQDETDTIMITVPSQGLPVLVREDDLLSVTLMRSIGPVYY